MVPTLAMFEVTIGIWPHQRRIDARRNRLDEQFLDPLNPQCFTAWRGCRQTQELKATD
jgi:hypothetical protein